MKVLFVRACLFLSVITVATACASRHAENDNAAQVVRTGSYIPHKVQNPRTGEVVVKHPAPPKNKKAKVEKEAPRPAQDDPDFVPRDGFR